MTCPRNESIPGDKILTGSAEFVVDLKLADEVEVSPHNKKQRGVVKIERSGNNDAAGKSVLDHSTEEDASSEDDDHLSELANYRKIHGHCNVPKSYSGKTKLFKWVSEQRRAYREHREGKTSSMTNLRI
jgi:hypothetical protein